MKKDRPDPTPEEVKEFVRIMTELMKPADEPSESQKMLDDAMDDEDAWDMSE